MRPKLVVGLGNPGKEYEGTRHNVGFAVVDRLGAEFGCTFKRKFRFAAEVTEAAVAGGKVTLAKPQTYMNRSGVSVVTLVNWLKLTPEEMLVVVDDADIGLGDLRLRPSGGNGGHNGLRSIIDAFGGNENFARLRIGVGRSGRPGEDISDHVLSRFEVAERKDAEEMIGLAVEAVKCCLTDSISAAMNRYNRRKKNEEESGKG